MLSRCSQIKKKTETKRKKQTTTATTTKNKGKNQTQTNKQKYNGAGCGSPRGKKQGQWGLQCPQGPGNTFCYILGSFVFIVSIAAF